MTKQEFWDYLMTPAETRKSLNKRIRLLKKYLEIAEQKAQEKRELRNKEKERQRKKEYRKNNREKIAAYMRLFRERRKENGLSGKDLS